MNWTDQDVDNLLASVEETLVKVDVLAKSASLKKDEDPSKKPEDAAAAPAQDAPPADAAPAADAGAAPMDAAPAADAGAAPADAGAGADPAAAGAAPGAEGDQALAGEQGEDAPLSDEELSQIYSSMAPDELERHYSIIRQSLQASYSQDQGQADQAGAPAPDAAQAAPAAPGADAGAPPEMQKSEDKATIEALTKQVGEQAQAIEQITKAFEVLTKPSRKSITDIQVMQKSEFDAPPADGTVPMTAAQVKEGARKLQPAKLEKGEREMVNKFFITGEGQEEVAKLINSKGGK